MAQSTHPMFTAECRRCARLAGFLDDVRREHPDYYARPVPSFGQPSPRLLIVGLAPGLHGANRTGRPFTGDHAGLLLYRILHRFGFASAPESVSTTDGLRLLDCRITNAVRCLPPQNKPSGVEVKTCNPYLRTELESLPAAAAVLALGSVAHSAVLSAAGLRQSEMRFRHGGRHALHNGCMLFDSYHCSRYNTQTRRLTEPMFADVFAAIRRFVDDISDPGAVEIL